MENVVAAAAESSNGWERVGPGHLEPEDGQQVRQELNNTLLAARDSQPCWIDSRRWPGLS
eukprot:10876081-Lingulodinium_polyedra.AAC.1